MITQPERRQEFQQLKNELVQLGANYLKTYSNSLFNFFHTSHPIAHQLVKGLDKLTEIGLIKFLHKLFKKHSSPPRLLRRVFFVVLESQIYHQLAKATLEKIQLKHERLQETQCYSNAILSINDYLHLFESELAWEMTNLPDQQHNKIATQHKNKLHFNKTTYLASRGGCSI